MAFFIARLAKSRYFYSDCGFAISKALCVAGTSEAKMRNTVHHRRPQTPTDFNITKSIVN